MTPKPKRDRKSGRYVDSISDKVCTACGHTLGRHSAERVDNVQECFADDCACESFTVAPKTKACRDPACAYAGFPHNHVVKVTR